MSLRKERADVAVIIPTYNHAHFLRSAIESVLLQTVLPSEIIVVDDGSSDEPEAVTSFFPEVQLIRQENRGLAAARNTGLHASSANHLLFLDADDRLKPNAINYGLTLLEDDRSAAFSYGAYEIVRREGAMAVEFRPAPRRAFAAFLVTNLIGMHATVMYRREPLLDARGFREGLPACEDYDLYLRLSEDHPVVCGPEVVAEYWHHEQNMSLNLPLMLRSALEVLHLAREGARKAGVQDEWERGVRWWKSYYSSAWAGAVRAEPNLQRIRQGVQLATLAPAQMISAVRRGLSKAMRR